VVLRISTVPLMVSMSVGWNGAILESDMLNLQRGEKSVKSREFY